MNEKISEIVGRIKALEAELAAEADKAREYFQQLPAAQKIHFDPKVRKQHRQLKVNLFSYALLPKPQHVMVAPFVYALIFPLLLLDLLGSLYHAVCFPLLKIPKVRRSDHFFYDRHHLAYLNLLEMMNCVYCSYGNGVLAYMTEIIARTEQYWCPIKHARRVLATHSHYKNFTEYGDAESFRRDLKKIRQFKD
jgi:hypothetical protein